MAEKVYGFNINGVSYKYNIEDSNDVKIKSSNGKEFLIKTDDEGNLSTEIITKPDEIQQPSSTAEDYILYQDSKLEKGALCINSFYCGGVDGENPNEPVIGVHSLKGCSHNFIELANMCAYDINLEGLSLQYSKGDSKGLNWSVLPLKGIIKSGGTFLIRGAQCSFYDTNTTKIKVDTFDMEWYDKDNKLKQFSTLGSKFYLTYGTEACKVANPYSLVDGKAKLQYGYIDLIGVDNGSYWGSSTEVAGAWEGSNSVSDTLRILDDKKLFVRYYSMDTAKQAFKAANARVSKKLWGYVDLTKENGEIIPSIEDYTPKSSKENKTFFYNKTVLDRNKPTVITCSFGIQATTVGEVTGDFVDYTNYIKDKKAYNGATRCFNWVSRDYYKEYLWIRKKGATSWGTGMESINVANATPDTVSYYYNRIRQEYLDGCVLTAHKQIVYNLSEGTYEYIAGHSNADGTPNIELCTGVQEFEVKSKNDVNDKFTFVQTSDQQGFKWDEYEVWNASAKYISEKETVKPEFMINTGDMTQSGNRINEWLDYFNGKNGLKNIPEMATIGNNDQSPIPVYKPNYGSDLDKINNANITLFYTFELDEENLPVFNINFKGTEYNNIYVPSLYSFNYGNTHFICVNSEITENTESQVYGYGASASDCGYVYEQVEKWLENDVEKNKNVWNVLFCHEMPFTILTDSDMSAWHADNTTTVTNTARRKGSHLNTIAKGDKKYWFSKFCQNNDIRLVIGGHKHTQATSWPLKEVDDKSYQPLVQVTMKDLIEYYGCDRLLQINDECALKSNKYPASWFENVTCAYETTTSVDDDMVVIVDELPTEVNNESDAYIKISSNNEYYKLSAVSNDSGVTYDYSYKKLIEEVDSIDNPTIKSPEYVSYGSMIYKLVYNNLFSCFVNDESKKGSVKPKYSAYFCNFELVNTPDAPVYAMSQATGYKHTSNKELPNTFIPWLKHYYPKNQTNANGGQKFPFYTIWEVTPDHIVGSVKKLVGIFDAKGAFEVNANEENTKNLLSNDNNYINVVAKNGIDQASINDDEVKIVIKK